ncbi:MAG TPA: 2-hydroxyglutaryl-CoA dehydratase [Bacteroidales bacterium]|nr:2-hydroxyglutaryl-CoA dehydratase [Bacteroidales bacterium]
MNCYRVGLDVGSTTAKVVVVDENGDIIFSKYTRHCADIFNTVISILKDLKDRLKDSEIELSITGSVGMGLSERFSLPFIQEVTATVDVVKLKFPDISTIIDIGGEDAKVVYLDDKGNADLRMNGNCAGGTGAFIDQMTTLLGVTIEELDSLAQKATRHHQIASRCGVFSKTDIQNLISKNVDKKEIAMSVFHAVAVQTVVTLSHGVEIKPKILFCGGPLTFIPSLRKAFINYLKLREEDTLTPENANLIPAWGAALHDENTSKHRIDELISLFENSIGHDIKTTDRLNPLFDSEKDYIDWKEEKNRNRIEKVNIEDIEGDLYIGIDSGSTTTKVVAIDEDERVVFSFYSPNSGSPIQTVKEGLEKLIEKTKNKSIRIKGSASTGYGEDLIKAAFHLDCGIIETIAHYAAAKKITPEVSFVLDIGGQDMKAMFIENGVLNRMEINEACSSGCGSFLETFAKSLNLSISDFASAACKAEFPCDLGTRCTVFMNSKIKQVLRENASIEDIAAGLSYSVVKNCLYKVLKIKNKEELGKNIVLQGGTMKNDSVVRAFELLTESKVFRSNIPELMGAYGSAIYAKNSIKGGGRTVEELILSSEYATQEIQCRGCENHCLVNKYTFTNNNIFFSGNKCEKIFSNDGEKKKKGKNVYIDKYNLLFNREQTNNYSNSIVIGIPRALNIYENYPFWHELFAKSGISTVLSDPSTFTNYEQGIHSVMSDNICFPAKLTHSHIYDLIEKKVDRIFMPYVIFEKKESKKSVNSYNCPIVSAYSDVIRSAIDPKIPIDSPTINFRDEKLLKKGCKEYLQTLGVNSKIIDKAIGFAILAQEKYAKEIEEINHKIYDKNKSKKKLTILLAGRPYHTDQLVQHKLSDMISDMGVDVISEDIVRSKNESDFHQAHYISQWAYINRILEATQWVAEQGNHIHLVQMTSFGCGPDAFLLDEVKAILKRYGKSLTILKIDDVSNIGSLKLRVRSLIESIKYNDTRILKQTPFISTKTFTKKEAKRKIIVPYFTDYVSPIMEAFFKPTGYDFEVLPKSDNISAEEGLKYANNEVCYPATLIIGDIIKALKTGKYDLDTTAVAITQTGGQCRASNYLPMIKSSMVEAGFKNVPVISVAFDGTMSQEQSGFSINWIKHISTALKAILYSDCISKFYYASLVREKEIGQAEKLKDYYLEAANSLIIKRDKKGLKTLLRKAAIDFNSIIDEDKVNIPKVGIVGEIFLKFNSFANREVLAWLTDRKIEVIPPMLTDFFIQTFVNDKVRKKENLTTSKMPAFVMDSVYKFVKKDVDEFNKIASEFKYYIPFNDIFETAKHSKEVISLSAQFGEGWLLPGEIVSFAKEGVNNVISLQPFGCIANHIISKGIEKKIKTIYPQMNLLSLDFDSGVSDVNITNRLHLMVDNIK